MEELFDVKDVFTSVNADDAAAYVDKYVYLSNSLAGLRKDIEDHKIRTLDGVLDDSNDKRFADGEKEFSLCIPMDRVNRPSVVKKYRPFKNILEFEMYTGLSVGNTCTLRRTDIPYKNSRMTLMYIGYGLDREDRCFVVLGGIQLYMNELINYEYLWAEGSLEEWRKFGVPEDER